MFFDALEKLTIDPSLVVGVHGLVAACRGDGVPLRRSARSCAGAVDGRDVREHDQRRRAAHQGRRPHRRGRLLELLHPADAVLPEHRRATSGCSSGSAATSRTCTRRCTWSQLALEPVDPIVFMPRLGYNPLPGHPVRPVYEPHGLGDSYFPTDVQDACAIAYGHKEAGDQIWPTMQPALALEGLDGMLPYPVTNDVTLASGTRVHGRRRAVHGRRDLRPARDLLAARQR